MRLAQPLPRSATELRGLQAELEREVILAVKRGGTREDIAATLLVLAAVERKLEHAADRPSLERRQEIYPAGRTTQRRG